MTVTIAGFDQSLLCAADVIGASRPVRVSLRAVAAARRRLGLGSVAAVSWSHIFSIQQAPASKVGLDGGGDVSSGDGAADLEQD